MGDRERKEEISINISAQTFEASYLRGTETRSERGDARRMDRGDGGPRHLHVRRPGVYGERLLAQEIPEFL